MRLGITKEIDWEYVGSLLAHASDEEQAVVLKSFVKECLTWGTHLQVERQLAGVNLKLTQDEIEVISMITFKEN